MFFKKKKVIINLDNKNIPKHIAIIMDGNGRWAKKRGLPRNAGHNEGGKALLKIVEACTKLGIKALTVYAFSTENWKRPKEEVDFIMSAPSKYINTYLPQLKQANIKMNFIGYLDQLGEEIQSNMNIAMEETKDNTGMIFTVALNYGSQQEILSAVKLIAEDYKEEKINLDAIDTHYFESKLMTNNLPPVDLMIRTSGEYRISNYLLWQIAYSEFYFTTKYWPDFDELELEKALIEFQKRDRRYGGIKGE